jgi:general secretion pathway protein B
MSYILDALRKADAQRERDPARGIHAQPVTALSSERDAEASNPLILLAWGVCAALLLALAAWWLAKPDAPADMPTVSPPAASTPAAPLSPSAPAVASSPAVLQTLPANELLPPAPPLRPAPAPPAALLPPSSMEPQRSPAPTQPPTQPVATAGERVLAIGDLPADVQRDLPKLNITGGVYSNDPARRLLIVNGLVLNEGAEAAPGVLLVQIRPKLAVLTFRGWRYGVAY